MTTIAVAGLVLISVGVLSWVLVVLHDYEKKDI